jgi:hypothetical protein
MKREVNNKNDTITSLTSQVEEIKQSHLNQSEILEYMQRIISELEAHPAKCCQCCSKKEQKK